MKGRPARVFGYVAACLAGGIVLGRAYGSLSRAPFRYPFRRDSVSVLHRGLLDALDVVEWPFFFLLALGLALMFWRLFGLAAPGPGRPRVMVAATACLVIGALLLLPVPQAEGRVWAVLFSLVAASLVAVFLRRLWMEACRAEGGFWTRLAVQLPLAAGHFAAAGAASLSLGFRGENALFHGILLVIAIGVFLFEVACATAIALWAARRCPFRGGRLGIG